MIDNVPHVKLGIVAVSRDCFPEDLAVRRRSALMSAIKSLHPSDDVYECPICIVESELDMMGALDDIEKAGCNALAVYLGNFGPEISETLLAQRFNGPKMVIAAAEETQTDLIDGRGDAYCGLLNASYNLNLRNVKAYIPEQPVGTPEKLAEEVHRFLPIAQALLGLSRLKVITFGPRPNNFLACNAPIKQLFDLGVEVEENSELDLFESFNAHVNDPRIPDVVLDMKRELGSTANVPEGEALPKLAQYEITLLDWAESHKGCCEHVVFAGKCWPAFQTQFGCVPCYVNSRMTGRGIPVSCEVDIYGALSEYIGQCVSGESVTLLDINNTVPDDMFSDSIEGRFPYAQSDTFMGFHCGNTFSGRLTSCKLCHQTIMARTLPVEVTNGTLEGDITPGDVTIYRLQGTAEGGVEAYAAQGEILPVATKSFGSIGVFAVPDMARFYRHVLVERHFPHHAAVAFGHYGRELFEVFKYLGIPPRRIGFNRPASLPYETENPFM